MQTYDCVIGEFFQLHATLFWTMNDFLAYNDLFGWCTKGYQACPICEEDKLSFGIREKYHSWDIDAIFQRIPVDAKVGNMMEMLNINLL